TPPTATVSATGPGDRLCTLTTCPASSRRLTIGRPMLPSPMKPSCAILRCRCRSVQPGVKAGRPDACSTARLVLIARSATRPPRAEDPPGSVLDEHGPRLGQQAAAG